MQKLLHGYRAKTLLLFCEVFFNGMLLQGKEWEEGKKKKKKSDCKFTSFDPKALIEQSRVDEIDEIAVVCWRES